ncbi:hypothetical protein AB4380_00920 [Vibrio breoganii]
MNKKFFKYSATGHGLLETLDNNGQEVFVVFDGEKPLKVFKSKKQALNYLADLINERLNKCRLEIIEELVAEINRKENEELDFQARLNRLLEADKAHQAYLNSELKPEPEPEPTNTKSIQNKPRM